VIATLSKFVEQRYFKVFDNRDYRWANELTVKTAFLTLLSDWPTNLTLGRR